MHRHPILGGLGVHNMKLKDQAGLIRTFLETAINPTFRTSPFHFILYKIRKVHLETSLNVSKMSESQWYRVLLEDNCT